jgi:hypothetical protein
MGRLLAKPMVAHLWRVALPTVQIATTTREQARRSPRALYGPSIAVGVALFTIAGLLPISSVRAAVVPSSGGTGTLRPLSIATPKAAWYALNDSNQVVGYAYVGNAVRPVRWDNGTTTTLTTGASSSAGGAFAIDNAGVAFGAIATAPNNDGFPAWWSPTGALTILSAAAGLMDSLNVRIHSASDNGNVIGVTANSATHHLAGWFYALPPAYVPIYLGTYVGVSSAAINDSGDVAAGHSTTPYLLVKGAHRPLRVDIATGFDLNNNDDVAGTLVPVPASGGAQAAIELANGTVAVLPPLHPGDSVTVNAINDHDEAVGTDDVASTGTETAVAWINGKVSPVTSLVAGSFSTPLQQALDVNNNGSILAEGTSPNGASAYYLLGAPPGQMVSGTVFGTSCEEQGCNQSGIGGVHVLVTGKDDKGHPVSITDVSSDDGSWSVRVPRGTYTAGPTLDGSIFAGPAFDPPTRAVVVAGSPRTEEDFAACIQGGDSSDLTSPASEAPEDLAISTGAEKTLLSSASSDPVAKCTSLYTLTLRAKLPPGPIEDASSAARYATQPGNDYRGGSSAFNIVKRTVLFQGAQYPACFTAEDVTKYADDTVKWYSYITGGSLPSVSFKLAWDQSAGPPRYYPSLSVVQAPVVTTAKMSKVFVWQATRFGEIEGSGTCPPMTVAAPVLLYPRIDNPTSNGDAFTVAVAWGFGFDGTGVKPTAESIGAIEAWLAEIKRIPKYGHDLYEIYEKAPPEAREALEIAIVVASAAEGGALLKLVPTVLEGATGQGLSVATLQTLIRYGGLAEEVEHGHSILEVASWINGFAGTYPIMAAVVRGQFTTLGGQEVSSSNGGVVGGHTVLGVSVASTDFPTISLEIQRRTYSTGSSVLPWADSPIGSDKSPATSNSFKSNPTYQVNSFSFARSNYVSGDPQAFDSIWNDTQKTLPVLYEQVKTFHNLSSGFKYEQGEIDPPVCSGTGTGEVLKTASADTICWRFEDGAP